VIAVDASLAAKWIFPEVYSDRALALADAAQRSAERLVAPPFLPIELSNIIRQRMRRESLRLGEALDLFRQYRRYRVVMVSPRGLTERALEIADAHGLPATYDAHYVALAEMIGCDLWTDDQRLLRNLAGNLPYVKWIGDY
jgi:predicted nucleic acid-binding protein